MKKLFVGILFTYCAIPSVLIGQVPSKEQILFNALVPIIKSSLDASSNLNQMIDGGGLTLKDMNLVVNVNGRLNGNRDNAMFIAGLAKIHLQMKHDDDRKIVRALMQQYIAREMNVCEQYSALVNSLISQMSNAAAISEIRSARDSTQQICAVLKSW
jgi:hypothetical protein